MKHIFGIFLIVLATLALGCSSVKRAPDNRVSIIGSGTMILQQAILAHSDRPEVGFAFDVTVRQADDFSVITSVDDNLADYLVLATEGRTLHIGLRPSYASDIPAATMRAEVVMPRLAGLAMSQSSHVTLMGLDAPNSFAAELSGSSAFGGSLETNAATFSLSGSTLARLSGDSQRVTIGICGNSVIDLRSFQVEDAEVEASCSSTVLFNLNGKLIADASQFAQVTYRGNPDLGGVETAESAMVIPE